MREPWAGSAFHPVRRPTRVVRIGELLIGGTHPIAVQSMTTTDTLDVEGTVAQAIRLAAAGCQLVRITAPTVKAARALADIRRRLREAGVDVPLAADIHFHPAAAMEAVKHVEKVRVNPGNFADTKAFRRREYTDEEYAAEVRRVEDRFRPLVLEAKRRGVALRIGTNHATLSDRNKNRWGDTPQAMVESAMEFVHVCEAEGHRDVVFSMKASNPRVMVQAYRLLAARLAEEGLDHPFHLGVTEAGEGEDARIKSAIGIGSLLLDGIGDTIRVSLTEDPVREIPVARRLVMGTDLTCSPSRATSAAEGPSRAARSEEPRSVPVVAFDPYSYARRATQTVPHGVHRLGGDAPVLAMVALSPGFAARPDAAERIRRMATPPGQALPALEGVLVPATDREHDARLRGAVPALAIEIAGEETVASLRAGATVGDYRRLAATSGDRPIILHVDLPEDPQDALLHGAAVAGSLLCDGIGDAVRFGGPHEPERLLEMVLGVLQGCRLRASRTEYIACPGCGRTLFDLETTTQRIRARTGHLPGVKIAVMGCIVNGPGEMADADFGYVGSTPGFVNLYVRHEIVERNVPQIDADERLVGLLKKHGAWREP